MNTHLIFTLIEHRTSTSFKYSIFARVPEYSALLTVFSKLFPAFVGQATVVFTMMHVFCYVGMYVRSVLPCSL